MGVTGSNVPAIIGCKYSASAKSSLVAKAVNMWWLNFANSR